jgi:hypothetical protein
VNLSGGSVPSMTYSWDLATLTATWQFNQPLADGNYRATLAGDVPDWSGALVDGNRDSLPGGSYDFDFFSLAGDTNADRSVDFLDLARLAQNYNTSSATLTYADGDFNGDGSVDFLDLAKLAQNYNTSLAASAAAGPVPIAGAAAMPSLASVIAEVNQPVVPVPTPVATPVPTPIPTPVSTPVPTPPTGKPKPAPAAPPKPAPKAPPKPVVKPVTKPVPPRPVVKKAAVVASIRPATFSTTAITRRKTLADLFT